MPPVLPSTKGSGPGAAGSPAAARQVGHVYLDVQQRKLHCLNRAAQELYRAGVPFTSEDLTRQPLRRPSGEEVRPVDLPLVRAWREQRHIEATFEMPRPPGPTWHVTWSVSPVRQADGKLTGLVGTVTAGPPEPDLRILAEMAHDLRTPLQALGMLSALLDPGGPMDPGLQESILKLRAAAGRALEVSRAMLDWCRHPSNRRPPVVLTWFPLEPYLVQLGHEQSADAERKQLALHMNLEAARGWEAHLDRARLGRLLSNLLSNAVRYTDRGRVEFTASWRGEGPDRALVLGVIDTGVGIDAEEQDSIFEPFERGRAGKASDSGGSGLGLASVDNLLRELGLALEVYSEHERGSAFHLVLPASLLRRADSHEHPDR
jgi:signal transduction histidine kinase